MQPTLTAETHTHTWTTTSAHIVSDGVVRYQRCTCGSWRILA